MSDFDQTWKRLTALARSAPDAAADDVQAPPGFATRVAAQWIATRRGRGNASAWEWLAVRGLAVACLVTVASVATAWTVASRSGVDEVADMVEAIVVADGMQ